MALHNAADYVAFTVERCLKYPFFRCSMCGQCVLRSTGLVCSLRCPKNIRNGPCGGATTERCEVYEDRRCVWVMAYERSQHIGGIMGGREKMKKILPPIDWRLWKTSSWKNLCQGKITMDGIPRPENIK